MVVEYSPSVEETDVQRLAKKGNLSTQLSTHSESKIDSRKAR